MRLKSFHGSNLTEAMRMVREALGEDAIIVATREEEGGGIRVTAAIDEVAAPKSLTPSRKEQPAQRSKPDARDEGGEVIEIISDALARHQTPSGLAEKLVAAATQFAHDDPNIALSAACDTHFRFAPILDEKQTKPLILIGPPGAGKTLCIAKLATRSALAKQPVTVISTDFERAGGIEQLAAFTRLLKLNLVEIEDAHALREIMSMQHASHIYIDTPGGNPFNESERRFLQGMVAAAGGEATLVMPGGMDVYEATDMAEAFASIGAKRLLLTRLDIARRFGGGLGVAYGAKLPLANYNASSSATDAPMPFNPVTLARLILQGPETSRTSTKPPASGRG